MGPFAMLQDAALLVFMETKGGGLHKLAVYHAVNRLRDADFIASNAAIGRALGMDRERVSEAMKWLARHGLIERDDLGWKAVQMKPVNLRERVRDSGRPKPKPYAQPYADADATTYDSSDKRTLSRTDEAPQPDATAYGKGRKADAPAYAAPLYRDDSLPTGEETRAREARTPLPPSGDSLRETPANRLHRRYLDAFEELTGLPGHTATSALKARGAVREFSTTVERLMSSGVTEDELAQAVDLFCADERQRDNGLQFRWLVADLASQWLVAVRNPRSKANQPDDGFTTEWGRQAGVADLIIPRAGELPF